jgi:hypothetical protein
MVSTFFILIWNNRGLIKFIPDGLRMIHISANFTL